MIAIGKKIEIASYVATIVAVIGGAITIHIQIQQARRAASIEYINIYNGDVLSSARDTIFNVWRSKPIDSDALKSGGSEYLAIEFKNRIDNLESEKRDLAIISLVKLSDFFDGLSECIDANVCDESTAGRLFGNYARDLYCSSILLLKEESARIGNQTLAEGLGVIASLKGPC